jgi:acyl carrier protein
MQSDTEARVRQIVASVAELPPDIPADANLYLDLGVASVHAMQLLVELEGQFDVQIPDEDFVDATSVTLLAGLIDRLRSGSDSEVGHA